MRLLVDTHAVLWFVWGHRNLSPVASGLLADPANSLLLSAGSLWEIAIKVSLGKLTLTIPYDEFVQGVIAGNSIEILPITVTHAQRLTTLPFHHRDPFDRLMVAQAIEEALPIISGDLAFDSYPVERLW
jgi:PIN domain nuclease of toxin-antitoxin system